MANQSRVSSAQSVQAHRAGSTKSSSRTNRMSQSRLNSNSTMSRLNSNSTMLVSRPSSNSTPSRPNSVKPISKVSKETPPPGVLTKQKILQKHFFTKENGINELEFLCKLKRARLDRLELHDIDEGMKLLQSSSHLYLQHVSLLESLLVI